MLSLLNASMLPWLAVLGIPVLIHLLTRRSRKKIFLPTTKFLRSTVARQSKVWKWRHLLILLMRTLAIAALVLAFAKPTWMTPFAAAKEGQSGVVVILDVSESMAFRAGGLSSLAEAQSQADGALSSLRSGDRANVVFCKAQPLTAVEAPTEDMAYLRTAIRDARPTEERGDAAGALSLALEQLGKTNAIHQKLYIVSDFQRTNWSEVKFESVPPETQILFVSVDSGRRQNIGLTALRMKPSTPRLGETVTVQAEVYNSADGPRTVPVRLRISDGRSFEESAMVGPHSTANVSFPLEFDKPARIELTASVGSDGLLVDNLRHAVLDLQQMANVVMITDEAVDSPQTAAFYMARALHPDPKSNTGFRVRTVRPSELNNPILTSADAVLVCNAPSMPAVQFEALARYAAGGGNLIWMLYGEKVPEQLDSLNKKLPKADPLPFQIEGMANLQGKAKGYVRLAEARYDSRLLKAFRDTAASSLLKTRFTQFTITTEVDHRAELLLKFEDGTPAAVRAGVGSGNLLLLNMSPAPSWSDLARQEIFVPLLHEFIKGILLRDAAVREFHPGGAAATSVEPSASKLTCTGPEGDAQPVSHDKTTGSVIIDRTKGSGFYRVSAASNAIAVIAVNPDPDESDLRSIDPRELETRRSRQLAFLGSNKGVAVAELAKGTPIWHYFLLAAVLMLLTEQVLRMMKPSLAKSKKVDIGGLQ